VVYRPCVGTIGELVARQAVARGDDPYLFFEDSVVSWRQFDEYVTRTANALRDLGVGKGDRVAVLMRNRPEYLYAWLGIVRLGAVYVPVIADNTPPEVEYVLEHCGTVALITTDELFAPIRDLRDRCGAMKHIISVDGDGAGGLPFHELLKAASCNLSFEGPMEDDLAQIAYTSGTTSKPKGVMHTHHPYVRIGMEMAERLDYTHKDRLMVVLPLFHGNAQITSIMSSLAAGASVALMPGFSPSRYWDQIGRYQPTEVNLLIGLELMLLGMPERNKEREHGIRFVWGTTTKQIEERFRRRFGIPIITTWSLTECSLGTMADPRHEYRAEWVGWPLGEGNEIRIMNPEGQDIPAGKAGEICVRNSCVMQGYYGQPEETSKVLRDGWLRTGDLGYTDEQGNLYFNGRLKNVIHRSGENISAEEVEAAIAEHPSVEKAAVYAVPDNLRVEEVKATIVTHAGKTLTPEEVIDWCEERLARFKVPRYIDFRDSVPTTPRGTIKQFLLRAEEKPTEGCWDRLAAGYRIKLREGQIRGEAFGLTEGDYEKESE
jgi:crotonobetaine/carnitine-CoA ligase